jgi:anti-sigma factor RsiW
VHLSAQQIKRYQQGILEPSELVSVGDHLDRCAACRERASDSGQVQRAFVAMSTDLQTSADKEPAHLSAEHLASYLEDQLGDTDRSIADSHLELCAECRNELSDLRALKSRFFPQTRSGARDK